MKNYITASPKEGYNIINLKDNKHVIIFKIFILINQKIINIFNKCFNNAVSNNIISYLKFQNNDIIWISLKNQNTIFIGNINNKNYSFKLNYLLDFTILNILKNE